MELPSSNRWARTLPREAARGPADVMPVSCQVHESRSSLCYKRKGPAEPADTSHWPQYQLRRERSTAANYASSAMAFERAASVCRCLNSSRESVSLLPPPNPQSFLATSVLGELFRNFSADRSAVLYSIHDGDRHTSYAHKMDIHQHTPTETRYRKIRVVLHMTCSISVGAH